MPESVDGGGAEETIGEGVVPFREIEVAGDNGGATLIAFGDELMEVFIFRGSQGFEAEVIDDEKGDGREDFELTLIGVSGAGGMEFTHESGLGGKEDVVAEANGAVAEGLGEVTFTGAARSDNEDGDLFLDKAAGGKVDDEGAVNGGIEREVEFLKGFVITEVGASQGEGKFFLRTAGHFILQDEGKEIEVREFVVNGLTVSGIEGIKDPGEAQFFEHGY